MTQEMMTAVNIDSFDTETQALIVSFISVLGEQRELADAEGVEKREKELSAAVGPVLAKILEQEIQAGIDSEAMKEVVRHVTDSDFSIGVRAANWGFWVFCANGSFSAPVSSIHTEGECSEQGN